MCFPKKDHRLNMLHSLIAFFLVLSILSLLGGNFYAVILVCVYVLALFTNDKNCFLCISCCSCLSAFNILTIAVLFALVIFLPHDMKRGILDDYSSYLTHAGLKGETVENPDTGEQTVTHANTTFHVIAGLTLLFLFVEVGLSCAIAYYSNQVYHYPGDVEDLRYGPGVDGAGLVVGVHDDEARYANKSRY